MKNKEKVDKGDWQPLRELALNTPYTMGYLSLMARRKQLKVKKFGRVWHSTMENIKEFEDTMRERKEERKRQLQESYREKVKREVLKEIEEETEEIQEDAHISENFTHPVSPGASHPSQEGTDSISSREEYPASAGGGVLSSDDTIFDEVQRELEEVLQEIRDREKKLRQDYLSYRAIHGDDGVEVYGNAALAREKQETEELSEKLIMDLGKLLNTANKIHEEEEFAEPEGDEGVSIPVRNKNARHAIRTMGMDFKRPDSRLREISNPVAHQASNMHRNKHKDNFLTVPYSTFPFEHQGSAETNAGPTSNSSQNKLLLFISGLLVFIAAILIVVVLFG